MWQLNSKNARTSESLNFLLLKFCNSYSFVELSNNEILDFLTSNSCLLIFVNGFHEKRESISGVSR